MPLFASLILIALTSLGEGYFFRKSMTLKAIAGESSERKKSRNLTLAWLTGCGLAGVLVFSDVALREDLSVGELQLTFGVIVACLAAGFFLVRSKKLNDK